jgi:hypothetical protein
MHARPGVQRLTFLDEDMEALFADRTGKARDTLAHLRVNAGNHPEMWPNRDQLTTTL